ncbi:hypothetical protein BDV96DRAFT_568475 [Lophiotrema nucula]|uniref:DUF7580 domain-containing protein n=1 Tax=Lophiotrema nucula TaxID=690887 RepID=A0A6A5ZIX4_9PLEO|nr:hypothetical protein BDV96DRAFT_568475 [Lophiotrema nucula]
MAGLEVAGVVLGSVPLVISALEHYREGVAVMKNMRDYEIVFDDIRTQFGASMGIYLNSCYQLLAPLNLPDKQLNELLEQRKNTAWADSDLQKSIEGRLGRDYNIFLLLMEKLNKRILLFCRKLKLNDDLKPPWVLSDGLIDVKARKRFFNSAWTRIRGGFDTEKYGKLLQEIDRDIDKISKLASSAIQLEPIRTDRKNRLQSKYWLSIRDQAQRVFESLSSRFHPCSCNNPHQANLRLDFRKSKHDDEELARFAFLFGFERSRCAPTAQLPWDWMDVEIQGSHTSDSQYIEPPAGPKSGARKTARFAPIITLPPDPEAKTRLPPALVAAKIDDLCRAIMNASQADCCIGVLEDRLWQHHVYSVTGPGRGNQIAKAAPLKEIISAGRSIGSKQKCMIALTLASSMLQLHDTPWLPRSWDTRDIFLLKSKAGTTITSQVYVTRTFSSPASIQAAQNRRRLVKNEMVFALGVALLELAHGCSILNFKETEDLNDSGQEDSMTEVSIATRLADSINDVESENYAKAVLRCIRCSFDTFTFDFNDTEFREKFYEGVVVPLQLDYEYATGSKI